MILEVKTMGHVRMESCGVATLPHLFRDHGQFFTAYDLMHWYRNTEKMVKVQDHAWGSQDHINVSGERLRVNDRRGHQD